MFFRPSFRLLVLTAPLWSCTRPAPIHNATDSGITDTNGRLDTGDTGDTGDSGDTGDTGVGPCLDVAPDQTIIENHTADGTPAGPVVTGPKEAVTSVMDRGGLPDDIALRIQKNLKP